MQFGGFFQKVKKYILDANYRFIINDGRGLYKHMSDEKYLKQKYKVKMERELDLDNPTTFSEKLQWLKLNDRRPEYTMMVDKYRVRKYIAEKLGKEYLIPLLGVWKTPDEIDFDKLPDKFVLKCNHNSGLGMCICKDKSKLDISKVKEELAKGLKQDYYLSGREWPYKNVPRRIIAEKFISEDGHVPADYKIYCFNGEPYKIMICLDRDKDEATKFYSFDFNWNLLRHNGWGKRAPEGFTLPKPVNFDKMYEFSKLLSNGIPFVRVDFYEVSGQLYFGEMTFYPDSGFDNAILPEIDKLYGSMINLPLLGIKK